MALDSDDFRLCEGAIKEFAQPMLDECDLLSSHLLTKKGKPSMQQADHDLVHCNSSLKEQVYIAQMHWP